MQLGSTDRLLVLAPHPDDETLAAGILIQQARAAGAAVRIVFATGGDNNPWPQRWLERRWRIDAAARTRWAVRRHDEALAALAVLGEGDVSARFLGWPDQGLTDCLMQSAAPIDVLAGELASFAPTCLALPSLADLHPDHGALRVMAELALLRQPRACTLLGYTIHGRDAELAPAAAAGAELRARKLRALQAYHSQLALSRRRLLALAERPEAFAIAQRAESVAAHGDGRVLAVAAPERDPWYRSHALLLVLAGAGGVRRLAIGLPRRWPTGLRLRDLPEPVQAVERVDGGWRVTLAAAALPLLSIHAKVHRQGARVFIFDRWPWQAGAALCPRGDAATAPLGVAEPPR